VILFLDGLIKTKAKKKKKTTRNKMHKQKKKQSKPKTKFFLNRLGLLSIAYPTTTYLCHVQVAPVLTAPLPLRKWRPLAKASLFINPNPDASREGWLIFLQT
jgi:hypothetical protein